MNEKEILRQLLHDLSTPVSVLLFLEDQMPIEANAAVKRLREIIEKYRSGSSRESGNPGGPHIFSGSPPSRG